MCIRDSIHVVTSTSIIHLDYTIIVDCRTNYLTLAKSILTHFIDISIQSRTYYITSPNDPIYLSLYLLCVTLPVVKYLTYDYY